MWWKLKRYVWYTRVLGPIQFIRRTLSFQILGRRASRRSQGGLKGDASNEEALNLKPGELVEVRSEKEILVTLDHRGKLKGLSFTPEMRKYCGGRFRVYKKLERIIVEATGELRTIKSPTVLLEGVICDGKAHGGCDRTCFCFWREAWLKRLAPELSEEEKSKYELDQQLRPGLST